MEQAEVRPGTNRTIVETNAQNHTDETDQLQDMTRNEGQTLDINEDLGAEETGTRTNRTSHTMTA